MQCIQYAILIVLFPDHIHLLFVSIRKGAGQLSQEAVLSIKVITMRTNIKRLDLLACFVLNIERPLYMYKRESISFHKHISHCP